MPYPRTSHSDQSGYTDYPSGGLFGGGFPVANVNHNSARFTTANNNHSESLLPATPQLPYPSNFFNDKSGAGPKNEAEAVALWQYRKNRPAQGLSETEPADGKAMLLEVQNMRARLKAHIETAFMDGARAMAAEWGLVDARNCVPKTKRDLVKSLCALPRVEGSLTNETIVYMVCHHFHHQKQWLAEAVDSWLMKENMRIEFPTKLVKNAAGKAPRNNPHNRGGFGACARIFKSDIVKALSRNMLTRAKWWVSTKNNGKQLKGERKRNHKYEKITIHVKVVHQKIDAFVVTEAAGDEKPAAKTCSYGSSEQNPIDLERQMLGLGNHIIDNLGITMTSEQLQAIIGNYAANPNPVLGLEILGGAPNKEDMSSLTSVSEYHNNAPLSKGDALQMNGGAAHVSSDSVPNLCNNSEFVTDQNAQSHQKMAAATIAPTNTRHNSAVDGGTTMFSTTAATSLSTLAQTADTIRQLSQSQFPPHAATHRHQPGGHTRTTVVQKPPPEQQTFQKQLPMSRPNNNTIQAQVAGAGSTVALPNPTHQQQSQTLQPGQVPAAGSSTVVPLNRIQQPQPASSKPPTIAKEQQPAPSNNPNAANSLASIVMF